MAVDRDIERDDSRRCSAADHDLVQGAVSADAPAIHDDFSLSVARRSSRASPASAVSTACAHGTRRCAGQKAQSPELHAKHRNLDLAEQVHRLENRAVAAQRDREHRLSDLGWGDSEVRQSTFSGIVGGEARFEAAGR